MFLNAFRQRRPLLRNEWAISISTCQYSHLQISLPGESVHREVCAHIKTRSCRCSGILQRALHFTTINIICIFHGLTLRPFSLPVDRITPFGKSCFHSLHAMLGWANIARPNSPTLPVMKLGKEAVVQDKVRIIILLMIWFLRSMA